MPREVRYETALNRMREMRATAKQRNRTASIEEIAEAIYSVYGGPADFAADIKRLLSADTVSPVLRAQMMKLVWQIMSANAKQQRANEEEDDNITTADLERTVKELFADDVPAPEDLRPELDAAYQRIAELESQLGVVPEEVADSVREAIQRMSLRK